MSTNIRKQGSEKDFFNCMSFITFYVAFITLSVAFITSHLKMSYKVLYYFMMESLILREKKDRIMRNCS